MNKLNSRSQAQYSNQAANPNFLVSPGYKLSPPQKTDKHPPLVGLSCIYDGLSHRDWGYKRQSSLIGHTYTEKDVAGIIE